MFGPTPTSSSLTSIVIYKWSEPRSTRVPSGPDAAAARTLTVEPAAHDSIHHQRYVEQLGDAEVRTVHHAGDLPCVVGNDEARQGSHDAINAGYGHLRPRVVGALRWVNISS